MHHTKHEADIGLAKVIVDFIKRDHVSCIPLSDLQAYNIVAILNDGKPIKLQVKYATLKKNGTVEIRFRRNWSDKNGTYSKHYPENKCGYYAVYCPEKDVVRYIPNNSSCPNAIRLDKSVNNQKQSLIWANDYLLTKRESSETIRHTPEMVKT